MFSFIAIGLGVAGWVCYFVFWMILGIGMGLSNS